jgi:biotin synthase
VVTVRKRRYHTEIEGNDLMSVSQVKHKLYELNLVVPHVYVWDAAWRNVKTPEFDQVLEMVRTINKLDMEVLLYLGMITENQAPISGSRIVCLQPQFRHLRRVL